MIIISVYLHISLRDKPILNKIVKSFLLELFECQNLITE